MIRTGTLFVASAFFSVALACGDKSSASGETASMCKYKAASMAAIDVSQAEGEKVQVAVAGLTCQGCATNAQAALMKIEGVNAAQVSHETGKADIAYDAAKTDLDKIIAAANEAMDYEVSKVEKKS